MFQIAVIVIVLPLAYLENDVGDSQLIVVLWVDLGLSPCWKRL